ncbi:Igfals [Symbiodinium natans]|uniref:Igfals protein n=1 Tax=Symbiodinium natans TaxID=878477 RepID=A0A812T0S0_9DINO|nr:Igfals [Symbiodinium natans]
MGQANHVFRNKMDFAKSVLADERGCWSAFMLPRKAPEWYRRLVAGHNDQDVHQQPAPAGSFFLLGHVTLSVPDADEAHLFYNRGLGMDEDQKEEELRFSAGPSQIRALIRPSEEPQLWPGELRLWVEDMRETADMLNIMNHQLNQLLLDEMLESESGGEYAIRLKDPSRSNFLLVSEAPAGFSDQIRAIPASEGLAPSNVVGLSAAVVRLKNRDQVAGAADFYEKILGAAVTRKYAVYERRAQVDSFVVHFSPGEGSLEHPLRGAVDFPFLDATVAETIDAVRHALGEPSHAGALLSLGAERLAPGAELGSFCTKCEYRTFSLVSFSELVPPRRGDVQMPTERRGITIRQLSEVIHFITDCAPFWYEAHPQSPHFGQLLTPESFNLYHANYWLISPSTQGLRNGKGCSYVELVAPDAASQLPGWFVSHAWLEPVVQFVACLLKHVRLRRLSWLASYWICAYANNQHDLSAEIADDPRKTSFFKAMQLCVGVVLILDEHATPFQRIWCCFEQSIVVGERDAGTSRLLLDVAATDASHKAHLITDGFAGPEQCQMPLLGFLAKSTREAGFPTEILQKGLGVNILDASTSVQQDKHMILRSIALRRASAKSLSESYPATHPNYDAVNQALASHFALAAFFGAVAQGEDTTRLLEALAADQSRRVVELSLTGLQLRDLELQMLLQSMPRRLSVLRLDLGFTAIEHVEFPEMPNLTQLMLRFTGSRLRDAKGLCPALAPGLRLLHLWFSNLPSLVQLGPLSQALAKLSLEELVLHLSGCPNVPVESKQQLYDAARSLKHPRSWRWRVDAWIHIEDTNTWSLPAALLALCGGARCCSTPLSEDTQAEEPSSSSPVGLAEASAEDLPYPCSHPGCETFHDDLRGFCQRHYWQGRGRKLTSGCLMVWRWLELVMLFLAQAAAEIESRTVLLAILVSLYLAALWSLTVPSTSASAGYIAATLSVVGLGSLAWTWKQFDRMQQVALQLALSMEAKYAKVIRAELPMPGARGRAPSAPNMLRISTLSNDYDFGGFGRDDGDGRAADAGHLQETDSLRDLYAEARRRLPHFERAVRAALAEVPGASAKAKIRLLTDLSSRERQGPKQLVDVLSCEVQCDGLTQVQAALHALKVRLESEESSGCFQIAAVHDGFAELRNRACCQVVISHQSYLSSVFLLDASLSRLESGLDEMYKLANSFGLLDEAKPAQWETSQRLPEPPQLLSVSAAVLLLRLVALLSALFLATQYFLRYAPARFRARLPAQLLRATFLLHVTTDQDSWEEAILLSLPYAVLVVVFACELLPGTVAATKKRARPTQVLYERYFGLRGSHYVLKVLVLQFGTVLIQAFGKIRLLGSLVTLAQHEAPRVSAGPFVKTFWAFCALIAWNSIYPAALLVLPDTSWIRGGAALMDAVLDLGYMMSYSQMVIMALLELQTAQTVLGNFGMPGMHVSKHQDLSNRVSPNFVFPSDFWSYAAVYLNVAHVCCVCRMLQRSSWGNLRAASATRSVGGLRKGWRFLGATAYAGSLLLLLAMLLASEDTYPGHSGDFRCFPCHCLGDGLQGLRLTRCPLVESLGIEQVSLNARNISEIAAEAFSPLGCQLRKLYLSGNPLVRLPPHRFAGLGCLQSLDLSRTQLMEVDDDAFSGLRQLRVLALSENRLSKLGAPALRHLPGLEHLVLGGVGETMDDMVIGGNPLTSLPPRLFAGNPKLRSIDLSHNTLRTLHEDAFQGLRHLHSLDLMLNPLTVLPPGIFRGLEKLELLSLSTIQLKTLPADIFRGLRQLKVLELDRNELTELPQGILEGLQLQKLRLHENQLRVLDPGLFRDVPELQQLWLDRNRLRSLPPEIFRGLARLQKLWLSHNELEELPPKLFQGLGQLEFLNLADNQLRELPGEVFRGLGLQKLGLDQNNFRALPDDLFRGHQELQQLDLHDNFLRELPEELFRGLESLQKLWLYQNSLQALPPGLFRDLGQLLLLNMSSNNLSQLPPSLFQGLDGLQELDLRGNELQGLHGSLFKGLGGLRSLYLSGNRIRQLPPEIFPARAAVALEGNLLPEEACRGEWFLNSTNASSVECRVA